MINEPVSPPSDAPFRIVVVSAGDVCRGPAVQAVLRARLRLSDADTGTVLTSSGTRAYPGAAMHPHTARALVDIGLDPGGHVAHRLTERRLAQADLVLATARDERRRTAELRPEVRGRSFTVTEFARLVGAAAEPPGDPRALVRYLNGLRAAVRPVDPAEDDLEDLAGGGSLLEHERLVRRVDAAVGEVARGLTSSLVTATPHWA